MPQYIASLLTPTKVGVSVVMVFAVTEAAARLQAAEMLKTTPNNIKVVNFDTFDTQ